MAALTLFSIATKAKIQDAHSAIFAMALLIKDDIRDMVTTTMADMITFKIMHKLNLPIDHLAKIIDFTTALDTAQAQTNVTVGKLMAQLTLASLSLNMVA
ncbi:hypothetical protein H0H87_011869 [Tephrocybe sp. NHM501043]|nr:hypothetical protein H0H87_011869 [Tephrocybe sp. NHM501043]